MSSPLTPDMVYELSGVADPVLCPDGRRMAYASSWVERTENGDARTLSRLMLMDLETGQAREFTQGIADTGPRFSPGGKSLAFLRSPEEGPRQVWVMDASGGEARPVTSSPKGVADFAWSPDGERLVYCADVAPSAGGGESGGGPQVTVVNRVRYRYDSMGWRGNAHHHLFVVNAGGGDPVQITDGDWDDFSPVWSPDGSNIAFISGRRDDRDLRALTEVYVVRAEGGEAEEWSQGLYSVGAAVWAPGGDRLAAMGSEAPEGMALWQGWLYVLEKGREPRRITDDSMRPVLGFPGVSRNPDIKWTRDSAGDGQVFFLGERHGGSRVYQAQADGSGVKALWSGSGQAASLSLDRDSERAVTVVSTPDSPGDIHLVDFVSGGSRQLTAANSDFMQEHPPARLEKFWIERAGYDIECRLLLPHDMDESGAYPLVLDIHGGPNGAFYDSFVPVQQALAAGGYPVLAVNPRGSSTYGNEFMMAVLRDWGGEDYRDLMAALEQVCERPYIDPSRLGIHGYSYGGYMTSWAVGHDDRFRAAVVGAPPTDLYSMYGTSDIGISFGEPQWGGSSMEAAHELLARSPITYASSVNTPVLLLHGELDARCPIAQSEEYFTVLKRLGKTVEFVRFPGCTHAFPRTGHPHMRREYMARTLEWFDRYLGPCQ